MKIRYVILFCVLLGISGCAQSYTNGVGSASGGSISDGTSYTGGTVGTGLPGAVESGMDGEIGTRAMAQIRGVIEREDGGPVAGVRLIVEAAGGKQEIVSDQGGRFRVSLDLPDRTPMLISEKGKPKTETIRVTYRTTRMIRLVFGRDGKLREGF